MSADQCPNHLVSVGPVPVSAGSVSHRSHAPSMPCHPHAVTSIATVCNYLYMQLSVGVLVACHAAGSAIHSQRTPWRALRPQFTNSTHALRYTSLAALLVRVVAKFSTHAPSIPGWPGTRASVHNQCSKYPWKYSTVNQIYAH